jgi:hypothetical protein
LKTLCAGITPLILTGTFSIVTILNNNHVSEAECFRLQVSNVSDTIHVKPLSRTYMLPFPGYTTPLTTIQTSRILLQNNRNISVTEKNYRTTKDNNISVDS